MNLIPMQWAHSRPVCPRCHRRLLLDTFAVSEVAGCVIKCLCNNFGCELFGKAATIDPQIYETAAELRAKTDVRRLGDEPTTPTIPGWEGMEVSSWTM
ncbi:MAG TPA: hypothetical protein VJG48_00020 [Candidatus Paceibacterota bacterium]